MTDTVQTLCPTCGSDLIVVGDYRLCLDCAYREELPPPPPPGPDPTEALAGSGAVKGASEGEAPLGQNDASSFAPAPSESGEPLWLPQRRRRGGVTTPLGFQAGHPCPRVCGGVLIEAGGVLLCTVCDFRYPEGEAGRGELPADIPTLVPADATLTAPPVPAAGTEQADTAREAEALRREVERLRDENRKLLKLVTDMIEGLTNAPAPPAPPDLSLLYGEPEILPAEAVMPLETADELPSEGSPLKPGLSPPGPTPPRMADRPGFDSLPAEGTSPYWWRRSRPNTG